MRPGAIATIGYEGRAVDDFADRLRRHRIELLVHVRDLPLSRKKGYSRPGIEYVHMRALAGRRVYVSRSPAG